MKKGVLNKRGVSAVVATVLIVMITVAAVGIIWAVIIPMITDSLGGSDVCKSVDVSIDTSRGYTCYDSAKRIVAVEVKKGSDDVGIIGIDFLLSSAGVSYHENESYEFTPNEHHIFYINISAIEINQKVSIGSINEISIVPVLKENEDCGIVSSLESLPNCNLGDVKVDNPVVELKKIGEECGVNSDCLSSYCYYVSDGTKECVDGNIGSSCDNDNDCKSNICYISTCSDGAAGKSCTDVSDCTSGLLCDGICYQPECSTDAECFTNYLCGSDGRCYIPECSDSNPCASGGCIDGFCYGGT